GIARTFSLTYRDVTQFISAASDFSSETMTAALEYGYPLTEYQAVRFGVALQRNELLTSELGSAIQAQEWVRNNGDSFERTATDIFGNEFRFFGTRADTIELVAGWSFDSRNRTLFADRGTRHAL